MTRGVPFLGDQGVRPPAGEHRLDLFRPVGVCVLRENSAARGVADLGRSPRGQISQVVDHVVGIFGHEDLQISEAGQNLSGGQGQRIAIARALLTEAPFIVFDEPTSALDPLRERQFVQTLDRLKGTRTIILVSHRLSTVLDCDCIYVLDEGRVVESGTHRELLQNEGHYWSMACQQLPHLEAGQHAAA